MTEFFCFCIFGTIIVISNEKQLNMKKFLLLFTIFIMANSFKTEQTDAYSIGELIKLRIHYGLVNAGHATLEVKDATLNGKKMHHVVGKGVTTGMTKFFFKVDDNYESYFDKETNKPYVYIRRINEGGYTKNQQGYFNQATNTVLVKDYKNKTEKTFNVPENVQDIVSSFYYLRNHPKIDDLKVGESITIDMFFDDETIKFKLKYLGEENISSKFGDINCKKFRPYVQAGRVFKEEESLTVWISDDYNKIPIRIKASLAVGSLKADLEDYKGLKYPIKFN